MKRIAEITGNIKPGSPSRSIAVRGRDVLVERAAADDKFAFDAQMMILNGWSAHLERDFQRNARACGMGPIIGDGDKIIAALEQAERDMATRRDTQKEKRLINLGLETSQMPPAPDFSDIPPPTDDDIPFDIK